jgi:hypothetical protein
MCFMVFLLVVAMVGGGWLVWCWHEELEHGLLGQHQRVRVIVQELDGQRARQRPVAELRRSGYGERR